MLLDKPKNYIANIKMQSARKKVNHSVDILVRNNLGFSVTDGITGQIKTRSRKELKNINIAAKTMGKFEAAFYPRPQARNNGTVDSVKSAHYEPIEFSDYERVQEKGIQQTKTSMHLRSAQTFLSRVNYAPRLQAHPNRLLLGLSSKESSLWSARTEALWRQDRELKDWDESGQDNYDQLSDIALWQVLHIGEFFAVNRSYMNDPDHTTDLSIQLFHPMQIQSPRLSFGSYNYNLSYTDCNTIIETTVNEYYDNLPKGNYIEKGIEYNKKGREIAIFIAPVNFGDSWIKIPFKNKAGFTQVLHGFIKSEPGQKRGLPDSAYAWHEFMNIRDLSRFEMQSARLNSTISGSVTADSNAQVGGQQGNLSDMGDAAGWGGLPKTELPEYEPPSYEVRQINEGGYVLQNFTPGYKYTEHNTSRPNLNVPAFIEQNLTYTHPATYGVATTLVSQKFEGSYNASKGKIDVSWKIGVEYYLKQFSSDWHRLHYRQWLGGKIAGGEITAPGWEDPKKRNAWASMSIITPAKPSLNPLQEAKAGKERISYGASSGEYEAQNQTNTSFDENMDRITEEEKKKKIAFPQEELVINNNKGANKNV